MASSLLFLVIILSLNSILAFDDKCYTKEDCEREGWLFDSAITIALSNLDEFVKFYTEPCNLPNCTVDHQIDWEHIDTLYDRLLLDDLVKTHHEIEFNRKLLRYSTGTTPERPNHPKVNLYIGDYIFLNLHPALYNFRNPAEKERILQKNQDYVPSGTTITGFSRYYTDLYGLAVIHQDVSDNKWRRFPKKNIGWLPQRETVIKLLDGNLEDTAALFQGVKRVGNVRMSRNAGSVDCSVFSVSPHINAANEWYNRTNGQTVTMSTIRDMVSKPDYPYDGVCLSLYGLLYANNYGIEKGEWFISIMDGLPSFLPGVSGAMCIFHGRELGAVITEFKGGNKFRVIDIEECTDEWNKVHPLDLIEANNLFLPITPYVEQKEL